MICRTVPVRKTGMCVAEISDALDVPGGTPEEVQAMSRLRFVPLLGPPVARAWLTRRQQGGSKCRPPSGWGDYLLAFKPPVRSRERDNPLFGRCFDIIERLECAWKVPSQAMLNVRFRDRPSGRSVADLSRLQPRHRSNSVAALDGMLFQSCIPVPARSCWRRSLRPLQTGLAGTSEQPSQQQPR